MDEDRRRQEIEEKRRKLAEIRLEKQRRDEARTTNVDSRVTITGDGRPNRQNGIILII
jgi:hypothetical protein